MLDRTGHQPSRSEELAMLVDLEARWENLRATRTLSVPLSLEELLSNQRAYESFHAKLVAYNSRHAPAHVPEQLVNTPIRLEHWCKTMGTLFASLGDGAPFPTHLLEKAYRLADRIAAQKHCPPVTRPAGGLRRSAVEEFERLAQWCAEPLQVDVHAA